MSVGLVIVSYVIPIILAGFAGILAVYDARIAPREMRVVRIFQACILWYFVITYGMALLYTLKVTFNPTLLYYIRSGLITRFGVVLLLIWLIVELWTSIKHAAGTH